MGADQLLPDHMQSWLGLCMGLRDHQREGALVVLVTDATGPADPSPSLLDYLQTAAAVGGLVFFPRR